MTSAAPPSTPSSTSATPDRAAATAWAGVAVRISRLRALRARPGSTTAHWPRSRRIGEAARARSSISSGVSGSPWRASCQLKANSASSVSTPVCSGSSRIAAPVEGRRSSTAVAVRSRPRLRGHITSIPRAASAVTPSSSRLTSSSLSSTIWSGTRSSSSRSSTGQASAAARIAIPAWVRARSPKPWSTPSPVHSRAASQTRIGSCSSWAWGTTRTEPATSSSSSASIRSESRTSWARSRSSSRRAPGSWSRSRRSSRSWNGVREERAIRVGEGALRGRASTTAATTSCTSRTASASSPASRRAWSSSAAEGAGRHRPSPGSNEPAATSRIPSSAAPAINRTLGWASSRAGARVSTGSAPRIGSVTVCRPSVNSTTLSRGVSAAVKTAGPVTGTKLTQQAPLGRTGGWRGP